MVPQVHDTRRVKSATNFLTLRGKNNLNKMHRVAWRFKRCLPVWTLFYLITIRNFKQYCELSSRVANCVKRVKVLWNGTINKSSQVAPVHRHTRHVTLWKVTQEAEEDGLLNR